MSPLTIPLSLFNAHQFTEYDESFAFQCPDMGQLDQLISVGRNDVLRVCREAGKLAKPGDDGIPKAPVWGPVTVGETTAVTDHFDVTQYYRLIPQGMENRFESTDGKTMSQLKPMPPALPNDLDKNIPIHPSLAVTLTTHAPPDHYISQQAELQMPQAKLYRVVEVVEVSPEDVSAEMSSKKRKNAKPAIYIRGSIVEPKLRVEI